MTEKKSAKILQSMRDELKDYGLSAEYEGVRMIQETAVNIALTALEEIQQYRSIGTVEECQEAMDRQESDCGGEWIVCEDSLPDDRELVLASDGRYVYLVEYDADLDAPFGDMDGIIAWMPLPKPYNPDRS